MPDMGLALDMAYAVGALALSPVLAYRLVRTGKWRTDWPARFGRCRVRSPHASATTTLLIHAVSVGEVNAIRGLVSQLVARGGESLRIVVSATTDTGFERARRLFQQPVEVVRFPFDFSTCVERFIDAVKPDVVALVELEVWPNFIQCCTRHRIPVGIINGRLSARSFRGYRAIRPLIAPTFRRLAFAGVQNRDYADRFIALGANPRHVTVMDSMKWDNARIENRAEVVAGSALAQAMGIDPGRPLIVAGSTGPGEERCLMDTCPQESQLLIAPRKPERFDEVAALAPGIIRRTEHPDGSGRPVDTGTRLFLLDSIGELRDAYALADVAIVGRSFLGMHGSDPLDPISLGVPTLIGPCHEDFAELVAALAEAEGIVVTDEPGPEAARLLAEVDRGERLAENGRRVITRKHGATRRHADLLWNHLPSIHASSSPLVVSTL